MISLHKYAYTYILIIGQASYIFEMSQNVKHEIYLIIHQITNNTSVSFFISMYFKSFNYAFFVYYINGLVLIYHII